MEQKLQQKNMREVWSDLNRMSGNGNRAQGYIAFGGQTWVDEINILFNRFDGGSIDLQFSVLDGIWQSSYLDPPSVLRSPYSSTCESVPKFDVSIEQVRSGLRRIKKKKSVGADGISDRVLKACADQICWVIHYISYLSLSLR